MYTKQHLTSTGFTSILTYYSSINRGMSPTVLAAFPGIIGKDKVNVILPNNLNPHWISGFTAGDGGFSIGIRQGTGQIYFRFHIAQHSRDILLMNLFIRFFGCGNVNIRSKDKRCDFYVQDFSKICDTIIPHFDTYPLYNIKSLDFIDLKKAAKLFKIDGRNNAETIRKIINNMNSNREF